MATRKLPDSWAYDFTLPGFGRQRQGGFKTKNEAALAERNEREKLLSGAKLILFADAYEMYMTATKMKDRSRDCFEAYWDKEIENVMGHLYIEEVDTTVIDKFKQGLPRHLAGVTVNKRLQLVRAVLRFMWKRGKLKFVPYVPMEEATKPQVEWYDETERDAFLDGMFQLHPQWYTFFYVTMRLGLRRGEVYAIGRSRLRKSPPQLVVDRSVQIGNRTKKRPAMLVGRKTDEAYTLDLPQDVVNAIEWHIKQGYSGKEFLFTKTGDFTMNLDSHVRPMKEVQELKSLRSLSHHELGRHSVASQAVTAGESIKAIQAQLGHASEQSTHKYAKIGSKVQLRLVQNLAPISPPHVTSVHEVSQPHGNVASTGD
ncbi:MAG: tyrosine-type recombinase/integrase [Deltaproteobacteria bacterium]|nr:tyrosine-type recombinase/integrase [Deltaproteobacteria bacterium]